MRILFLLVPTLIFSIQHLYAQERCAQVLYENMIHPLSKKEKFENWMKEQLEKRKTLLGASRTQATTYRIPVVVHVVHNGEPVGTGTNISVAQIQSQIDVLNKDYKRQNSDASNTPAEFQSVAGSINIEFVLARQDPNGLPTNGIVRVLGTQSSWTMSDNSKFKSLSYWPAENYLNIWVISFSDNFIGYAQLPLPDGTSLPGLEGSSSDRLTDGVVIDYRAFGSSDYGNFNLLSQFDKGRTATHEIGHFFGLRHTWGDDSNCSTATDYVDDTPKQNASTSGCPTHPQTSCNNVKMFQNYLDYTNDRCMNLFTQGQVDRMDVIINNAIRRKSLLTSLGATAPSGATSTDLSLDGVRSPGPVVCDTQVTPKLTITNRGTTTITNFSITAQVNGGPANTQNFSALQFLPGEEKDFTLNTISLVNGNNTLNFTIQNPNGQTDSEPSNNSIALKEIVNKSTDVIPLRENFNFSFNDWTIISQKNSLSWETASSNYQNSLVYRSYNNINNGQQSWLISPVLDFSKTAEASLLFDISYALRSTSNQERLQIFSSTDCGITYSKIQYDRNGSQFSSSTTTSSWQPTTNANWEKEFVDLSDLAGEENVRLAFVVTNQNGNNLYVDNLEFYESADSNPPKIASPYYVYATSSQRDEYAITFNLQDRSNVSVYVYDLLGQKAAEHHLNNVLNQTYPIEFTNYVSGIYIVRVQIGRETSATKIFVSR